MSKCNFNKVALQIANMTNLSKKHSKFTHIMIETFSKIFFQFLLHTTLSITVSFTSLLTPEAATGGVL